MTKLLRLVAAVMIVLGIVLIVIGYAYLIYLSPITIFVTMAVILTGSLIMGVALFYDLLGQWFDD